MKSRKLSDRLFAKVVTLGIAGILSALPAAAQPVDYPVDVLADLLVQTQSLRANVSQLVMDQDGRELQENTVTLMMQKPASFSWHVTEPFEEMMVTDGTTLWRYEPDLEQVTIEDFDEELDRTPVMLLNGTAETIAEAYDVSATRIEGDILRFILTPLRPSTLFERMSLTFEGPTLREMQFEDSLGQQTSLGFTSSIRNLSMSKGTFTFDPPAGVEIIDNRAEPAQ